MLSGGAQSGRIARAAEIAASNRNTVERTRSIVGKKKERKRMNSERLASEDNEGRRQKE